MKILTGIPLQQTTYTSSTTLGLNNAGKLVIMNVASSNNVTVPPNASVNFQLGTVIHILQYGLGQTTIVAGSGVTILANNGNLVMGSAGEELITGKLTKIDTNTWLFENNINFTDLSNLNASNLTQGTVPTARLGTGTADSTTYLRGDNTWQTISAGGLTKFTEAQSTASPNATVNVDSLTAIASTTDADISIVPKGSGAFLLAIPNGTATGGNKRGANAVDLQTNRALASEVSSGVYSVNLGGSRNTSSGVYSVNIGGYLNTSSGVYSVNLGGNLNTSSGNYSVAGGYNNTSSNSGAVSLGFSNTSSGSQSTTFGSSNIASGQYSVAMGYSCTASGLGDLSFGYQCTASGGVSVAIGRSANTFSIIGRQSFSSGYIATSGDCQSSDFYMKITTTDATLTAVTTSIFATTPGASNQVILQNNSVMSFKGRVTGKQTSSTNVGVWDIDGVIVRGANAGTTTLVVSNVTLVTNASGWGTPTLTADTTNGGMTVKVQGLAGTSIGWNVTVKTDEVIY